MRLSLLIKAQDRLHFCVADTTDGTNYFPLEHDEVAIAAIRQSDDLALLSRYLILVSTERDSTFRWIVLPNFIRPC